MSHLATALAFSLTGDAAFQGIWAGWTTKVVLYGGAIAGAIGWLFGKKWGVPTTMILGIMGWYTWIHFINNNMHGDAAWEQLLGISDGLVLAVCIIVAWFINKSAKTFLVAAAIGLFIDLFVMHWLWPNLQGFSGGSVHIPGVGG